MKKINDKDESPKAVSELNGFKMGDFVKVKDGIKDPDDDKTTIGNWCGRIAEIYDNGIALIKWDSITIRGMNIKNIRKYEKEGFLWGEINLGLYELEKTTPRDNEDDADEEISKILWQCFRKEYFPEYYD
ncbi:MAG TPA: hypothetical protein DD381_05195 [Lentisphaeria bacterium]|nr:MAG: hypothetical protein A2X47_06220 [Lentisphaerae bacterium GWF2_38_69]HBM15727.1 hypothetical protein [Lentisphaeria bacterium]